MPCTPTRDVYKRQVLQDARAVLGQGGAAAQEQCTASLGALLQALMAQGVIGPTQPDALARMLDVYKRQVQPWGTTATALISTSAP